MAFCLVCHAALYKNSWTTNGPSTFTNGLTLPGTNNFTNITSPSLFINTVQTTNAGKLFLPAYVGGSVYGPSLCMGEGARGIGYHTANNAIFIGRSNVGFYVQFNSAGIALPAGGNIYGSDVGTMGNSYGYINFPGGTGPTNYNMIVRSNMLSIGFLASLQTVTPSTLHLTNGALTFWVSNGVDVYFSVNSSGTIKSLKVGTVQ